MSRGIRQDSNPEKTEARVQELPVFGGVAWTGAVPITAVLQRYLPFDWAVSGYLAVTGVAVALWGNQVADRWKIVLLHLALIVLVFSLVRFLSDRQSWTGRFFRLLYLPLGMTFFYEETSFFLHLFHSGWFDQQVILLERSFLGVSPTLFIQAWQKPLLSEWMMLGYFSYYILVAVPLLVLYFERRDRETAQVVWAQSLAFFISYLGFFLYPIQGPRFEFAGLYEQSITGYLFVPLVDGIMKTASIHGGCMPSSHVAVAVVCLVYLLKYKRRLGLACVPFVATLCLATVYGRFHYVSDVIVGILVGLFAVWVSYYYPVKNWMVGAVADTKRTRR